MIDQSIKSLREGQFRLYFFNVKTQNKKQFTKIYLNNVKNYYNLAFITFKSSLREKAGWLQKEFG